MIIGALIVGLGLWICLSPDSFLGFGCVVAALVAVVWVEGLFRSRRFDRMAQSRVGESICDFAQVFRRDGFDPVVVRTVYELTQEQFGRTNVPLRPTDRLDEEFGVVAEDVDDLAEDAARLAHRSFEAIDQNPLFGRVYTVGDLVHLLQHQPKLPT